VAEPPAIDFSTASGETLVRALLDEGTLARAHYELRRRADPDCPETSSDFVRQNRDPEVVVCPQGADRPPVYLVLYESGYEYVDFDRYVIGNPIELFPDLRTSRLGRLAKRNDLSIDAFTAKGTVVRPFEGNNVLERGIIADLNGDGLVERASFEEYGLDRGEVADVLEVSKVLEQTVPVFAVVFNWGDEADWDYAFTDRDHDGLVEIELGPRTERGIQGQVVFRWDRAKQAYLGPAGSGGAHFRVIDGDHVWDELKRLEAEGLTFPKAEKARSPSLSQPYRYRSLRGLTNEELLRYMDRGRSHSDAEYEDIAPIHAPDSFWNLPAKQAALEMANANRTDECRQEVPMVIDDRDGKTPSGVCALHFAWTDLSCEDHYVDHCFLRVSPDASYFAFGHSWDDGDAFCFDASLRKPAYDLRFCSLKFGDAEHLAHVIWWLNRVRTPPHVDRRSLGGCSADGEGAVRFVDAYGNVRSELVGTVSALPGAATSDGAYTPTVCLALVHHLLNVVLPLRLGADWSKFELKHTETVLQGNAVAQQYEPDEMERLKSQAARILALFSLDQTRISHPMVRRAAAAAGDFCFLELAPRLRDIQARFPAPAAAVPTEQTFEDRIETLEEEREDTEWASTAYEELSIAIHQVEQQFLVFRLGMCDRRASEDLRAAIAIALRKFSAAGDSDTLQRWATSTDRGRDWALDRLSATDRGAYVTALRWWVMNARNGDDRRGVFQALAEAAPEVATRLLAELPAPILGQVQTPLEKALALADDGPRVAALTEILCSSHCTSYQRRRAVDSLVPQGDPLKFSAEGINASLVSAVTGESNAFTCARMCLALVQRTGAEHFDLVARCYEGMAKPDVGMWYVADDHLLPALVHAAQIGGEAPQRKLAAMLHRRLKSSYGGIDHLVWAAWAADLRELRPDIERIATSAPSDTEGIAGGYVFASSAPEAPSVSGRYHMARKLAALWNEEDALTRAKLLLALGFHEAYYFVEAEGYPDRDVRMKTELTQLSTTLSSEQKRQIAAFLAWYEQMHITSEREPCYRERRQKLAKLARRTMGVP